MKGTDSWKPCPSVCFISITTEWDLSNELHFTSYWSDINSTLHEAHIEKTEKCSSYNKRDNVKYRTH